MEYRIFPAVNGIVNYSSMQKQSRFASSFGIVELEKQAFQASTVTLQNTKWLDGLQHL